MAAIWEKTLPDSDYAYFSRNDRIVIFSSDISEDASNIQVRLTGHSAFAATITGVSIGERSSDPEDFNGAPTRITFGGSNSVVLGAGASIVSDQIAFSVDKTKDYLFHVAQITTGWTYVRYASGDLEYFKASTDDDTLVQNISGYTSQAYYVYIYEIYDPDLGPENSVIPIISNSPNVEDNTLDASNSVMSITVSSPFIDLGAARGGMFLVI